MALCICGVLSYGVLSHGFFESGFFAGDPKNHNFSELSAKYIRKIMFFLNSAANGLQAETLI